MKKQFIVVLALVGFSTSVFARTGVVESAKANEIGERLLKEIKERKAKNLDTKDLEAKIASELAVSTASQRTPEEVDAGLKVVFGTDIMERLKFGRTLRSAADVPEHSALATHTLDILARIGTLTRAEQQSDVQMISKIVKNIALTQFGDAVDKYTSQMVALNTMIHAKYAKNAKAADQKSTEEMELIGVLNVKRAEFGITDTKVIYDLKAVQGNEKEMEKLRNFLKDYLKDC